MSDNRLIGQTSTGAAEVSATDRPQMAATGEQNEGPTRSAVTPTDEPASSTDEDHSLERSLSQEGAVTESAEENPSESGDAVENTNTKPLTERLFVNNLAWGLAWQTLKDHFQQAGPVVFADVFMDDMGRSKGCGIVVFEDVESARHAMETLNNSELGGRPVYVREDREEKNFMYQGKRRHRPSSRSRSNIKPLPRRARAGSGGAGYQGNFRGGYADGYMAGYQGGYYGGFNHGYYTGGSLGVYLGCTRGGFGRRTHRVIGPSESRVGRQVFVGNLPDSMVWQNLKDLFRDAGVVQRADVMSDYQGRPKGIGKVLFETAEDAQVAIEMFDGYVLEDGAGDRALKVHLDKYALQLLAIQHGKSRFQRPVDCRVH